MTPERWLKVEELFHATLGRSHGERQAFLDEACGEDAELRVDARGNRRDLDAQFAPPDERLAFRPAAPGEADLPEIWPAPLPIVVQALSSYATAEALGEHLPDLPLWTDRRVPQQS